MKYVGSKAKIIRHMVSVLLQDRHLDQFYAEPFCGGMNSLSAVSGPRIANDSNTYLIEMWRHIIDGWIPDKITKEQYTHIRDNKNLYAPHIVGWVGFNCSYRGKWFGGFAGEVHTKDGTRDYQDEALRNVLKQAKSLDGIILSNVSYELMHIPSNSIVYCDPPYEDTTGYKDKIDYAAFWDWARNIAALGNSVFISSYNAPSDFECVWSKELKSSLSLNGTSGGFKTTQEKLFRPIL